MAPWHAERIADHRPSAHLPRIRPRQPPHPPRSTHYRNFAIVRGGALPPTNVHFFRESTGDAPVLDWLRNLRRRDSRAYAKCAAAIHELAARGHELRRPLADYIVAGIHELRVRVRRQNYRVLYFFHAETWPSWCMASRRRTGFRAVTSSGRSRGREPSRGVQISTPTRRS